MSEDTKQIGDVVGVDRMDTLDRQKLTPETKLELLCREAKAKYGRDPRSGGFSIVARPRVVLQVLLDIQSEKPIASLGHLGTIRLQRPVIVGAEGGDIVGWWNDVPIVVRCSTVGDVLVLVEDKFLHESLMVDRQRAALLRMSAHNGRLEALREQDN